MEIEKLTHIGLGRTLDGTRITMLISGYETRIINTATGELLRKLTINPNLNYHPTGKPPGGPKGPRKPKRSEPK